MKRRRGLVAALAAALVLSTGVGTVLADGDSAPRGMELKVALQQAAKPGKCGKPSDALPPLAVAGQVRAGTVVLDATICLRNTGGRSGMASLGVLELVDSDPTCTGDEAEVDATCGDDRRGELAPSLVQDIGVDGKCGKAAPAIQPSLRRGLDTLPAEPVTLATVVKPHEQICVRLVLSYLPPDPTAATRNQSDVVTWRYEFRLTS